MKKIILLSITLISFCQFGFSKGTKISQKGFLILTNHGDFFQPSKDSIFSFELLDKQSFRVFRHNSPSLFFENLKESQIGNFYPTLMKVESDILTDTIQVIYCKLDFIKLEKDKVFQTARRTLILNDKTYFLWFKQFNNSFISLSPLKKTENIQLKEFIKSQQ